MAILIKGAKMPEGCQKCKCLRKSAYVCGLDYDYTCLLGAKQIPAPWYKQLHNRALDCPLVEIPPHGRLIEAEPLIKRCAMWKEPTINDDYDVMWNHGIDCCINEITHHTPTILLCEE